MSTLDRDRMKRSFRILLLGILLPGTLRGQQEKTLKNVFREHFLVGAAISPPLTSGRDTLSQPLVPEQFNSVTATNEMKWERIHPEPGKYNFSQADRFVEYGKANGMHIVGHTLVWHSQTPRWVFQDSEGNPVSRDTLLARMKAHIETVVGRYRGRVHCWDVVNEAIDDNGKLRDSPWLRIIGEDYIEKAFTYARQADPDALLIYNDYSMTLSARREGVIQLVKQMQGNGIRVDGIGMQAHYHLDNPDIRAVEASILAFSEVVPHVMITELDVSVLKWPAPSSGAEVSTRFRYDPDLDPYRTGLPDTVQLVLAQRYADLFGVFTRHADKISRVTFWGVHDGESWKNNFPMRGRTDYPLLFDRERKPKKAFDAVIRVGTDR